jgi:calcineurin-like phosphoesterase family protein
MRDDGTPLRGGFTDINHHDEFLIQNWNKVVGVHDKVYHLGDVGFRNFAKVKATMDRLNGTKVLIKGNHDNFKLSQYAQIFKDVRAYHVLDKFLLSHIPVHTCSVERWKGNLHGHLHDKIVGDNRYINLSVEQTKFSPVDFEYIRSLYN